jgi:hypothetical protein
LVESGYVGSPGDHSVSCRALARDALKPWQHRSWISVRDPEFAVKAARVLDLYAGIWDGRPTTSPGPDQVRDRLAASETRYNAIARPFTGRDH